MKLLGKYSISSKLKFLINIFYVAVIILCILAIAMTIITMTGILPFVVQENDIPFLFDLSSKQFENNLDVKLLRPEAENIHFNISGYLKFYTGDILFLSLFLLRQWGLLIVYLIVIYQLRKLFYSLSEKTPFVIENSKIVRIIGITIIAGGLFDILTKLILLVYFNNCVTIPDFSVSVDWSSFSVSNILNTIFLGIVIVIIAEIFQRGAEIEEEQKLTI